MAHSKAVSDQTVYARLHIFSGIIRVCHWLRALSILALVITGFYIAWPFLVAPQSSDVLVQGWIRMAHEIFGFILIAVTVSRVYLFFFSKDNIERRSFADVSSLKAWKGQLKAYLWMGHNPHAGAYGPLQFMVYFGITLAAIFMCVTGLVLYANVYHQGLGGTLWQPAMLITEWMGGLAVVRLWHHYVTWAFIIFVVIHVYMAVWTGIRFKHNSVDSIVSGYNYLPKDKHH